MHTTDLLSLLGFSVIVGLAMYFHIYYLAVVASMVYVLFLANVVIHYLSQPLPRLVVIVGDACDEECDCAPAEEKK